MATLNKKTGSDHRFEKDVRLAGGMGKPAARQDAEALLRRSVMACLLWEDIAYASGDTVATRIADLVPLIDPQIVREIAVECRYAQKLRHVPLLIVREMARHDSHKMHVQSALAEIINRPDEMSEFLSIYWKDGKCPLAACVKRGLADAFQKFDEYQLAKWNRPKDINLRDVLFLCHAKPKDEAQAAMWKRLVDGELATPDTWEVGLSAAKTTADKVKVWSDLILQNKLGAVAVLKNLRNMQQIGVSRDLITQAIETANPSMLLPINFLSARKYAPDYTSSIERLMFKCAEKWPRLTGWTVFVVDVSGSMACPISSKSQFARYDAAAAMAVLASEMCDNIAVYATAGGGWGGQHATAKVAPHRGFALADAILETPRKLGGGGIFTAQCLDYLKTQEKETPDRIIIFSDSQDCDASRRIPQPFGKFNYIVDVSCHTHGVNYDGVWDAEVSGWSESFLRYIASHESNSQK